MDAPPSQYRVIERGRKLIVLDARTNLPPKQACDIHPAGHGLESRPTPPQQALPARRSRTRDERHTRKDSFEEFFDRQAESAIGNGPSPFSIGVGAVGIGLFIAVMIGGVTGFMVAAATIIIAGNVALRSGKKRS